MSALILCVWTKHFLLRSSCVNIMLRIKRTCPRSQYPLSYRPRVGRHRWHRVKINGLSSTMPNLDIRELNESDLATQWLTSQSRAWYVGGGRARHTWKEKDCISKIAINLSPDDSKQISSTWWITLMCIEHRVALTGSLWPAYSQYGSYVHKRLNKTLAKIHRIQAWPFIVLSDDRHGQADGNNG